MMMMVMVILWTMCRSNQSCEPDTLFHHLTSPETRKLNCLTQAQLLCRQEHSFVLQNQNPVAFASHATDKLGQFLYANIKFYQNRSRIKIASLAWKYLDYIFHLFIALSEN